MITELVSSRYGDELYKIRVPEYLAQKSFLDVMTALKQEHGVLCLGIEQGEDGKLMPNPDNDYQVTGTDHLVVISDKRPRI